MINGLVTAILNKYIEYELVRVDKKTGKSVKSILPKYVTKRKIQIYNNGVMVFNSDGKEEIPPNIQYVIKCYGVPEKVKPNNKTPLIYNINTTLSSVFSSEKMEKECIALDK